ncbi:MAG: UDP-N-acetylmuramoyl-tripeptide--D-alanyl-D-alanine ligase [Myxococcota bacterium]
MKSYCFDTRILVPGDIFVAIHSEKRDGHDFVAEAYQKGASAAIVHEGYPGSEPDLIRVPDPLRAFQNLAHEHLLSMPARRVALTGSSGKTSTKNLIVAAIKACLGESATFATHGNFNNHLGVPLMAFQVTPKHQVAVFEMGMSHFGEIARLAEIVEPQVGLITNIGSAHGGVLGGPDGVAKAKAELFEALGPEHIGVVNADDPRCMREANIKLHARPIYFGQASWADVRILDFDRPTFCYKDHLVSVDLPLLGHHNVHNAAAALAVVVALNLDFETAAAGLEQVEMAPGRLNKKVLENGAIILDDTYNANPESMEAGLSVLASFQNKRRIAVLGDMAGLGESTESRHHAVGAACAQKGVDLLFACGPNAKHYAEGAFEAGLPIENFTWAEDSQKLGTLVRQVLDTNDVIWVKGSRIMAMEQAVENIQK